MKFKTKKVLVTLDERCIQLVDEAKFRKNVITHEDEERIYFTEVNLPDKDKDRSSVIAACIEYCLLIDDEARADMSPTVYIDFRKVMVKTLKEFDVNENNELVKKK